MARNVINIRIELDREVANDLYAMAKSLTPDASPSKRTFARRILRRSIGLWKKDPNHAVLQELGFVKHGLDQ